MKHTIALFILGCSMAAMAQTAKVIQLTPEEAKQAKALYDEQQDLTKRQGAFDESVRKKHLEQRESNCLSLTMSSVSSCVGFLPGWDWGRFVFSDDFKFIVPKPNYTSPTTSCNWTTVFNPCNEGYTTVQ